MRVNKIIEMNKHYEHRGEIEFKPKKDNSNNENISFSEILNKNMKKIERKISTQS
ncbi:hypothetical protein CLHOM_03470 [Clostridium homopropionicum DSM 5847]|uniref:Uncharacterized protein n=1 Tax=Clostridium homopropionicum DSM 5847 TaxID=1121318 RepID=A0A0L6ZE49_9CLOT|nr:hypothetical protein [Clostridium homopropionicum]KOA21217.1 hypothetical protein CLHOM_03470 [Clostridium homopropionicum DSM 5847]SFG27659.1 hypothetical protein SAMN04488501_10791 [Clostridium homopropionicum]